jgi:hypothetical protein
MDCVVIEASLVVEIQWRREEEEEDNILQLPPLQFAEICFVNKTALI